MSDVRRRWFQGKTGASAMQRRWQPLLAIDEPLPCQSFAGWLDVRGWALAPDGAQVTVRVSVDGQPIRTMSPSVRRPDVQAAYPAVAGSGGSGFQTRIERSELPSRRCIALDFEVEATRRLPVLRRTSLRLVVQRRDELVPLVREQLASYVTSAPSATNPVSLFEGEWSSALPPPFEHIAAGRLPLFDDPRLRWALDALGGVDGQRVLELGPLEGGHTWMLERAGAAEVVAVEANARAYLRCLVVKELLGLTRSRFLLGDFLEYLRQGSPSFQLAIASGVLYHMRDPMELIARLAQASPRLFCWTHYYDPARLAQLPQGASFDDEQLVEHEGFRHRRHRLTYVDSPSGFCGGIAPDAHWLSRDDILDGCRHFGLTDIDVGYEEPEHATGPCFALVARRAGT